MGASKSVAAASSLGRFRVMRMSVMPASTMGGTAALVAARSSWPSSAFLSGRWLETWKPSLLRPAVSMASRIRPRPAMGSMMSGPQGIQPLPKRTMRRITLGLRVPLTQSGTPPG